MEFELYYIIFFCSGEREKSCMGNCLEQPLFNVWTRGATPLALLLDEGVASSSVHILPYIYISFPPISFLLIIRENPSL